MPSEGSDFGLTIQSIDKWLMIAHWFKIYQIAYIEGIRQIGLMFCQLFVGQE